MSSITAYVQEHYAKAISEPLGSWLLRNPLPCFVEPKFDGRRALIFYSRGKAVYATKHNGTYTVKSHPELFSILPARFNADFAILDTEVYPKARPTNVAVFDLLEADSIDYKCRTLQQRKAALSALFADTERFEHTPFWTARSEAEVLDLKEQFVARGFEGVMAKNPRSTYGDPKAWLKLKKNDTDDLFVIRPDPDNDTFRHTGIAHSWFIGKFDKQGNVVEHGKVGDYTKDVDPSKVVAGTVVEILFQEGTKAKKLRDPRIIAIRDDKTPAECVEE